MFTRNLKHNVIFRAIAIALICLFCTDTVIIANPDTLAPLAGNPIVYQKMRDMMEERLAAHQDPIDEFIRQHANIAKNLSSVPYLEEEFKACINACKADNMLTRLKTTLASSGGRIQIVFVNSEDELPLFAGKKVWGHAGAYVTAFALDNEKDSKEGRGKIIARLFHEIRARATKAKELFDEELKDKTLTTPEEIAAFVKSMREKFEDDNLRIQQEIEQGRHIISPILAEEFASLTFAIHPDVINRDYAEAKEAHKAEEPYIAQGSDTENIGRVIADIRAELAKVDGKKIRRKYVNEDIKKILLSLRRENKLYFNTGQADRISKMKKLNKKLGILRLLFLYKDNGIFVFEGSHLTLILAGLRKEDEIKAVISALKKLGIVESYHVARILANTRKEEEVEAIVSMLKENGIAAGAHLAPILTSSREKAEMDRLIVMLKSQGITEGTHLASILASSRKEESVKSIVNTLKGLGITEPAHLAPILRSSRKEEEMKSIVSLLKNLGITEPAHLALILRSSRTEREISNLIAMLKSCGIVEHTYIARISASSRKEADISSMIAMLKSRGITEPAHLARILATSREEAEIDSLITMLKSRGITEGAHIALVLASSRKEEEIGRLIAVLKLYGITEGSHIAFILASSRKETEIKSLIDILKEHDITEPAHLALILSSSRKEKEIELLIGALKSFSITKSAHLAQILAASREKTEIGRLITMLNSYGITEGSHIALILASARKETEIKSIIGTLKERGITEGAHLAPILTTSRGKEEITTLIAILQKLGITESTRLTSILHSSRKEEDILSYANAFMKLKDNIAGFNISSSSMARMITNPELVMRNFSYMLKERAMLPPLDRLLSDEEKEYIRFRLLLRQFSLNTIYGLIDIFTDGTGKREEIKRSIGERIMEENERLSALLKVKTFSEDNYKEAGLLLFSCDEKIRIRTRDALVERRLSWIDVYANSDKQALAGEILLNVSARYNMYHNLLADDLRYSSYNTYLKSSLKLIGIILYYQDQPESLRRIRKEFSRFRAQFTIKSDEKLSRQYLVDKFAEKKGYDTGVVLLALGPANMRSLDKRSDKGSTLMNFIPAESTMPDDIIDTWLPDSEEAGHPMAIPDDSYPHDRVMFGKSARGSIPGIFKHLCDNNITEGSEETGQAIADNVERSFATINYDLRALLQLKLIQKPEEDRKKSGKDARYYVPEAVKKKAAEILPILEQFKGEGLRPASVLLDQVYEEKIRPIFERAPVTVVKTKEISFDISIAPESLFPIDRIKAELTGRSVPVDLKIKIEAMTPEKMQLKLLNAGEEVAALTMVISSDQLEIDKFAGESLPKTHILATRNMYSVVKNTKIVPTWPRNVKTLIYHNLKKRVEIQYFELTKDLRGRGIGNVWYQSHVEPYLRRCNAPVISVFGTCLSDPLGYIFWKKQGFDQDLILNLVSSNDETQHTMLLKILPESKASEKEILAALPQEWYKNEPRAADFTAGLSEPLQIENILNPDKSTFIFSEKVTFDNGLGVLLPKLAKSGMKIAVMATTDAQRALIEELNRGKPKNERIICQATFADIRAEAKTPRYYYFKVDGDPAADMPWIMTFDISAIVKKIIDSLGKVSGIVERERLELLREAARKFAEAA